MVGAAKNDVGPRDLRHGVSGIVALVLVSIGIAQAEQLDENILVYPPLAKGRATFVTAKDHGVIPLALPGGRTATEPMDFLEQHGHLFGVSDAHDELTRTKTEVCNLGQTHTTFQQYHSGVRVFGGIVKVHQDAGRNVVAANGHFFRIPAWLKPIPTLSPDAAATAARAEIQGGKLAVEHVELVVVDPAWYGDPPVGAHLAYYVILSNAASAVREAFFVDAHTGKKLDQWSLIHTNKERRVYTAYNVMALPGTLWRSEGQNPADNNDINRAYDYAGDSYDFFFRMFGRDGPFGNGNIMNLTAHWGPVYDPDCVPLTGALCCPIAFWDGIHAAFCTGIITPETVGHELGHGLMQTSGNLLYQNQSGQLNESFSDVWGELIDLFNGNVAFPGPPSGPEWPKPPNYFGSGLDTPNNRRTPDVCSPYSDNPDLRYPDGVRWLHGEDRKGLGADNTGRDMWEPTCSGIYNDPLYPDCCPDRANHPLQTCGGPDAVDNGGNHSGSSIPNHAFAILTDGKTFNGYTVTGIGPIKAAAVWYRALTVYVVTLSDFEDTYVAMNRAAYDLIATTPNDPRTGGPSDSAFTAFDAEQVDLALRAVEMNTLGACGASADVWSGVPPEQCAPQLVLFSDAFESGVGDWLVENTSPPTPYDWVLTSELPLNREDIAWFVADPRETTANESARHSLISPSISIPTGINEVNRPKLAFTHYIATQYPADGGNVRISVNGGPWELIATEAFEYNPYNSTISGAITGNDNPLQGETVWTGVAASWGTSVVDLSSLLQGGETIRIRFDFGKDAARGYDGWYVDDFAVYICSCEEDAFCDDEVFCNGAEFCMEGICRKGDKPCGEDYCDEFVFACVPAVFWDDFDNGNLRGWELQSEDNTAGENGWWVIGNPVGTNVSGIRAQPEDPYSGLGCAYTGQNPDGQFYDGDVDNGITYMISPTIDLSGHSTAELSYVRWFFELARGDDHDDFFAADVSDDNGANWVNLETVTMTYTDPISYRWTPQSFQLEDFIELTGTFKLRFAAQAEPVGIDDTVEAAVDEVIIVVPDMCSRTDGDANGDCSVDLADYASWPACMTGPGGGPHAEGCQAFDFNGDDDVDLKDLAQFVLLLGR